MSSDNIKVVVRARPHKKSNTEFVPWIIDKNKIYQIDEDNTPLGDTYSYDEVFNVNKKNVDIYDTAISSLVRSAIEGINLTIFAYGATSSGKTYTMNGTPDDPGTIPRFIEDIFDQVEFYSERKFLIRVSYVEIYSEVINDLLDKTKKDLKIREDFNNCVSYNPKEEIVKTSAECMHVMKTGAYNRTVGETQMNQCSSRSHAIFRIVIESAPKAGGENDPVQVSHVNLIDLAGSERVSQTGATGQRFKEGAHINKSLTALGLVMKQLVEKNEYVNYRDSKLTRILSNSLGGNAKTLIICNINLESLEDTASTLMFAQRAKAVKNKPKVNEVMTEAALTKKYAKECAEVKRLLESEFEKNKQLEVEREMSNKKISELDSRIRSLQEIFVKKDPVLKPPKRRHTFCTLGAISEERELENASRNLITVGLRGDEDSSKSSLDSTLTPPRRNSCEKALESIQSCDITPTKNLRDRLEILTREHEDLIEYTRLEKVENQNMTKQLQLSNNECQDLKLQVEAQILQLKVEHEKKEQLKVDYEFLFESQKKKFERREQELLEQINKLSTKSEVNEPIPIEYLPLPNTQTVNTFEYEEMSEKIISLKNEIEELQNSAKSQRLENRDMNVIIADLRKSVNTLELQNSQLKIKNKSLQSKVVDMELKVNNSQQVADFSNDGCDSLKQKIKTMEANNKELESELGRVKEELYESQDKLMDVTEDLDIEEKKSSRLQMQLEEEKKLRQKVEMELSAEGKLRKDAESNLEKLLRQEATSKLDKGMESGQEVVKDRHLSLEVHRISKENNEAADSTTEVNWKQDIELELNEAESKYLEQVELRKEIHQTLCMLHNILEPKSQQNGASTQKTNKIILNEPKESVSEYESVNTSEIMSESYLNISDAFLDCITPNESMQDTLESFSSSYFKDSSKSTNFMNFFNSFVNTDNEVSQQKKNAQTRMDEIDRNHESCRNEIELLRQDSNSMKLQRESDILTINKLQAQLEEYGNINLSDSEKLCKTNKILEALNILEREKADNISVIQTLKQQLQTDAVKSEELQRMLDIKSEDLKKKNEEIRIMSEKVSSQADKSEEECIETTIVEPNLEKEFNDLHQRNINLEQKIEAQKTELEKHIKSLNDKETYLQNLSEENRILREKVEKESSDLEQAKKATKQTKIQLELYKTQVTKMDNEIQEKDNIIIQVNKEKMKTENEMKILQAEKYVLEKNMESRSQAVQICQDISSDQIEILSISKKDKEEIIATIDSEKINLEKEGSDLSDAIKEWKIPVEPQINHLKQSSAIIETNRLNFQKLSEANAILKEESKNSQSTLDEECEKNETLLQNIEIDSGYLPALLKEKEIIIARINEEKNKLQEEKNSLSVKMNDLSIQIKQQKENEISNQDKITNLLDNIQQLKNEIEKLLVIIQDKEQMVISINSEKIILQKEQTDLSVKTNDLLIQVETKTNHITELSEKLGTEELRSQKIIEEIERMKKECEQIDLTLEEEQQKNAELLKHVEQLEIKLNNMLLSEKEKEILIADINEEKSNLVEERNILNVKLHDLYKEVEQLKTEIETTNKDKEENIHKNTADEIEKLSNIIQDKDTSIATIKLEKNKLEEKNNDLLDKINYFRTEVERKINHIAELNEIIENKEVSSQKLVTEKEMMEREREQIDSILKKEIEKNGQLVTDIQKLEIDNKNLILSLEKKDILIAQITSEKIDHEDRNAELLKHIEELKIKLNDMSLSEREKEVLIANINEEKFNLVEERNNLYVKLNDLYKEIEQRKIEFERTNMDKENINKHNLAEMKNEIEKLSNIIQDKDTSIATINLEKNKLEEQKNDLLDKINHFSIEVERKMNHIAELNEIIENKEVSSQNLLQKKEMMEREREEIDLILKNEIKKNGELATTIEKLENDNKNLFLSVEEKKNLITRITSEKIDLEKQKNTLSVKINDLLAQTEKQDRKIRKQNEILEDRELRLQKLSKEYEKFKEEIKENVFLLKSERIEHEDLLRDIQKLKMENSKLSFSVQELSKTNSQKINEIRSMEECYKKEKDLILSKMEDQRLENEKEKQHLLSEINSLRATVETQLVKIHELQEVISNKEIFIKKLESYNQDLEQDIKKKEQIQVVEHDRKSIDEIPYEGTDTGLLNAFDAFQKINADLENQLQDLRADYFEKLGDFITNMKTLLGMKVEKRPWNIRPNMETNWQDLKNIEEQICSIINGSTANHSHKTDIEDANKINEKLKTEIQLLEEQKKFLQKAVEKINKQHEITILDYENKLQQANKKLKTIFITYEQDKKKIENLEYELRIMSKKTKASGSSNHHGERDGSEYKSSEGKWKQQRAEAHDSRRSIDLNTLCSESTVFRCKCENMDKKVQELNAEVLKLKESKEMYYLKYEKVKKLCRIRNDEMNELKEQLKRFTSA